MDDQQWYERILRSIDDPSLGLPGFPSVYQQEVFVGKSNEVALAEEIGRASCRERVF